MSAFYVRGLRAAASFVMVGILLGGCSSTSGTSVTPAVTTSSSSTAQLAAFKQKINHIVIIYQENWSFDGLFGRFPGANGYANATNGLTQYDAGGNVIATLPPVLNAGKPDPNFAPINAGGVPVAPFNIASYVSTSGFTSDPNHNFYLQQAEIDGGRMDRYLAYPSGVGGLTFGYYDTTDLPEGKIAQQYTLLDNFHQSAFGGSFLNNIWAACACTPQLPLSQIPSTLVEPTDASGNPLNLGGSEGRATPDGYIVNTSFSTQYPQIVAGKPAIEFVPPLTNPTLGDKLSAANVSWKFYSGGLANALAGTPDPTFQPHHQSYLFFQNYAPGTPGAAHIVDVSNFATDLTSGNLPAVSWIKPLGANNEHPGYANLMTGQMYVANLISQIQMSPAWKDTMVVVFYDEAGGHYDHVSPTPVDRWGPSTRVPAYIVSPFAKRGYVDHSNYEVTSILKTIELRFGLDPLSTRDANAAALLTPFDFSQATPSAFARKSLGDIPQVPAPPLPMHYKGHPVTELDYDE